jgi:hypothetical protein
MNPIMDHGITAGKEAHVKPQTDTREQRDGHAETGGRHSDPADPMPLAQLSEEQRRILDCLQTAGSALTLRQLETRTAYPAVALENALDGLLQRDLVARLNTLFPSYSYRYPGIRVYAE